GELAGGGAALAVVHLEGEEIDPFAGVGAGDGAEDDGVAVLDGDGACGELGEAAGLDREGAAADLALDSNGLHYGMSLSGLGVIGMDRVRWATDGQIRGRDGLVRGFVHLWRLRVIPDSFSQRPMRLGREMADTTQRENIRIGLIV